MPDYGYARSDAISVTVDKWYQVIGSVSGESNCAWRVKLRYETQAVNEVDGTEYATLDGGEWGYFGYCFQAQYTDPDFRIYLIARTEPSNLYFDNISFREVLLYGALGFKYEYQEDERSSNWIRVNPQGVVYPMISANDFRVKFKAADYRAAGLKLDYIKVRFKLVDKRAVRGLYNVNKNVR